MKAFYLFISFMAFIQLSFAQPQVGKKQFQLFLLAGQSNMAGRGKVEAEDTITNSRIWVLNKNDKWELAKEPLHFDKPGVTGVGPGFAFAKAMAELDTNIVIGLVPCAVGGSPIEMWEPGKYYEPTKSHPYDDAMRRTKLAMQSGTLNGILWHQGESDSDSTRSIVYSNRLVVLVRRFRNDLKIRSLPFVAGTIGSFYVAKHPFGERVNDVIKDLPKSIKQTAVVTTEGLTDKGDVTHFSSASARELGRRYAQVFIKNFGSK